MYSMYFSPLGLQKESAVIFLKAGSAESAVASRFGLMSSLSVRGEDMVSSPVRFSCLSVVGEGNDARGPSSPIELIYIVDMGFLLNGDNVC